MSEDKKYYWLKLKKDFFKRHDIQIIEAMPNGKDYILFYLKMLVESVDHNGNLRFNDTIPYSESMLSTITNTNIDIVRSAMNVFTELKMIDILEDSTIFMAEVDKMTGAANKNSTERVIKFREKQKLLNERDIPSIEFHINNKRYGGNYYKVLDRDKYCCMVCGDIEKIMVHHVIPYDTEDEETVRIENLITLCSSCHTSLHNKSKNKKLGILPDEGLLSGIGFNDEMMKRYRNISKQYIDIELDIDIDKEHIVHFFESVWLLYPNKKGKGQISDTQKKKLYKIGIDKMSQCIQKYKDTKEDWKKWQNGSTFFNSGYIDYLDENYQELKDDSPYRRVD